MQSYIGTGGWLPEGSRWLDLYSGTGAVGLEGLSRGECANVQPSLCCMKFQSYQNHRFGSGSNRSGRSKRATFREVGENSFLIWWCFHDLVIVRYLTFIWHINDFMYIVRLYAQSRTSFICLHMYCSHVYISIRKGWNERSVTGFFVCFFHRSFVCFSQIYMLLLVKIAFQSKMLQASMLGYFCSHILGDVELTHWYPNVPEIWL